MSDRKLTLIASKGTLDWAYPPFILASTAAAVGYQVTMFLRFTVCSCCGKTLI